MSKLFKVKKTRIRNLTLILLPLVILVTVFGVLAFKSVKSLVNSASGTSNFSNSIEKYDYQLRSNATDYQKAIFTELKDECNKTEKDEKLIAILVCKNFVADFYTWTNKSGTTDVGGMQYIYKPARRLVLYNARTYMYQHLDEYIQKYGSNNLLEVESSDGWNYADKVTIELNGKTYDSYNINISWKYKNKSGGFDISKYATSSSFQVYKNDDGRFEILSVME